MFEAAELDHQIDKQTYDSEVGELRASLLQAQVELVRKHQLPVILIISGVDGVGKGDTVHVLNQWMDPRHIDTHAMGELEDLAVERPPMWRFWRELPPNGKVGVFFGSWYTQPLYDRAYGRMKRGAFTRNLDEVVRFEKMLTDEGTLLIKLWLHLSRKEQRAHFKALEKDPDTRWRVTDADWKNHRYYNRYCRVAAETLRQTSTPQAPWVVVAGGDARFRQLTVGKVLLSALQARLSADPKATRPAPTAPPLAPIDGRLILRELNLDKTLETDDYDSQLEKLQGRLNLLSRKLKRKDRSVTIAFEGYDAAGKGGAIRRVTEALDARHYRIVPVAAPNDQERAHPYLWRFWQHIPARGEVTIFDRSWYGRVLVERVEKLCSEADWQRAYSEINDFEQQLIEHGTVLVKLWLSISKDEQLRRFEERKASEFKHFKLTDEDWRNRKKWDDYERAASDMIESTSTPAAPWTLVEGNDKRYARLKILTTIIAAIESRF